MHNNARIHTGHATDKTIQELRSEFWDCPSHSLDVALWNFYLFSLVKEHQYTGWTQDTVAAMTTADTVFYSCSQKLVKWWDKCINVLRDCVKNYMACPGCCLANFNFGCCLWVTFWLSPYFYLKHYKLHAKSICHLWMSSGEEFGSCCT